MSKLFSVSLATFLMLMNIAGPMHPVLATDPSNSEQVPVAEQIQSEDGSDVVLVEDPLEENQPVETEPVESEQEELVSEDAPEASANSSPESDEEVSEVPADTGNLVIVPNAVDPNPGECPIDEICDGGGGDNEVEVNASFTAHAGTAQLVSAIFTISNGTTSFDIVSDAYGVGHTKLTKGATYQVTARSTSGVYTTSAPVTITPNQASNVYRIEVFRAQPEQGSVTFQVLHGTTNQPLENVDITLVHDRTWSSADKGVTVSNGTWTSKDLALGNYVASVEFDGFHGIYDILVTIPSNGTIQLHLYPIQYSPIALKMVDADTGLPVAGASFWLAKQGHGTDVEDETNANGEFVTGPLEHGVYFVDVWADGYGYVQGFLFSNPSNGTVVIELQPIGDGTITFQLVDENTDDPVPNANITILDADTGRYLHFGKTNAAGVWETPTLAGGYYDVAIHAKEHYYVTFTVSVVSGNQVLEVPLVLFNDVGYMAFYLTNEVTGQDLPGVNITIYKNGLVATGTTDSDGFWNGLTLESGKYTIVLEKPGYFTKTIEHGRMGVGDESLEFGMKSKRQLDYRIILRVPWYAYCETSCNRTGSQTEQHVVSGLAVSGGFNTVLAQNADDFVPAVGATVQLLDPVTGEVLYERTTDEEGLAEFLGMFEGDDILKITGPKIKEYSAPITLTDSLSITLPVEAAAAQEPGDGDGDENETPTNSEPGDGDGDEIETPINPEPGNGDGDDTETPTNPEPADGVDDNTATDTDSDSSGSNSEVAQTSGSSDSSENNSVSRLPSTGVGADSHAGPFAITLAGIFLLPSALGVRRSHAR